MLHYVMHSKSMNVTVGLQGENQGGTLEVRRGAFNAARSRPPKSSRKARLLWEFTTDRLGKKIPLERSSLESI